MLYFMRFCAVLYLFHSYIPFLLPIINQEDAIHLHLTHHCFNINIVPSSHMPSSYNYSLKSQAISIESRSALILVAKPIFTEDPSNMGAKARA